MLSQIALKDRMILMLTVILAGVAGGMLVFYFISKPALGGFSYVEKITERQVYLENSSKIEAVKNVANALITVVEANQVEGFVSKIDGNGCFEVNSSNCGANGLILTSDGLVLLSGNSLGADYQQKAWVALDNSGKAFDLKIVASNDRLGVLIGKMIKHGEKELAENLRTNIFDLKTLTLADEKSLKVGQEVLLLKNNLWNSSANVKTDLIQSLRNESLLKESKVVWNFDQRLNSIEVGSGLVGEGIVLTDLGGQIVGFETLNSAGVGQLVSASEISALLSKYQQKSDWKDVVLGVRFLVNNKANQQAKNLEVDYGVLITELNADAVLTKNLGLKVGDLVLSVDNQSLINANFSELMNSKIQGQKVLLVVLRAGKKVELRGNL